MQDMNTTKTDAATLVSPAITKVVQQAGNLAQCSRLRPYPRHRLASRLKLHRRSRNSETRDRNGWPKSTQQRAQDVQKPRANTQLRKPPALNQPALESTFTFGQPACGRG
ncbi:Hypothetical_protein [Hexamita inflata]|uniref:Hypothetical_protein n=1 Tax=Hexamita inflata TaxID=28002 RepID=A0ABP1HRM4_9EUKA